MDVLVDGDGRGYAAGDRLDQRAPLVWAAPGIFASEECAELVRRIEALGPTDAPITTAAGFVMRPDIRNNTRVVFDDEALAADLFARLRGVIPEELCGMNAVGANERFRCYRYEPGQRFAPHYDGAFVRDDHERSLLTLMVYLNETFTGGRTAFHHYGVETTPKAGDALLFQHRLLHEGCVVESGAKYVLRSDVMYRD